MGKKKVGFVGSGENKFTAEQKENVQEYIREIIYENGDCIVVSGGSPMGGIDIWAEEIAKEMGRETDIKRPKVNRWDPDSGYGFKARNLDIARESDVLYIIVPKEYPPDYKAEKFGSCYHCDKEDTDLPKHIKSGGCWTGWKAVGMKKRVIWALVENEGCIDPYEME